MWSTLSDVFLHLDTTLQGIVFTYGAYGYPLLFLIFFCETGLVVTPFLPGDSLLFASGALAGIGAMNVWILFVLICLAVILGDTVNYEIGARLGRRFLSQRWVRFFIHDHHVEKAELFFQKHGAKTIVLARFVPIIRTFAPFVAGVAKMPYPTFFKYNVIGGCAWVTFFLSIGYFFGNLPFVKSHFSLIVLGIIILSLVPVFARSATHEHSH